MAPATTARVPARPHAPAFRSRLGPNACCPDRAGQSLQHLDRAHGVPLRGYTAAQITIRKPARPIPSAPRLRPCFCAMLGTMAGNLALTLGRARRDLHRRRDRAPARSGFAQSPFRARFEAKGRFSAYLAVIPTYVVTHPLPAFSAARRCSPAERSRGQVEPGDPQDDQPQDKSFQAPAGSPNHRIPITATIAVPTPDQTA